MRRPSPVELMLLTTIGLWSLNLTISRYILTHGFQPLAYATVRYGLAVTVFILLALVVEGSLRIGRRDLGLAAGAAVFVYVNQISFVYALERSSASVLGLDPRSHADLRRARGRHAAAPRRFRRGSGPVRCSPSPAWRSSRSGTGGELSGDLGGVLLGVLTAATWAGYSMLVTPLMRRYTATRISAVVLAAAWVPLALTGISQVSDQDWGLGWEVWALLVFATLGPLVVTNELWFRSLDRIGPARATLAANLQPFLAAAIAVVLLSESLGPLELVGGALIASGIVVARRRRPSTPPGE